MMILIILVINKNTPMSSSPHRKCDLPQSRGKHNKDLKNHLLKQTIISGTVTVKSKQKSLVIEFLNSGLYSNKKIIGTSTEWLAYFKYAPCQHYLNESWYIFVAGRQT